MPDVLITLLHLVISLFTRCAKAFDIANESLALCE